MNSTIADHLASIRVTVWRISKGNSQAVSLGQCVQLQNVRRGKCIDASLGPYELVFDDHTDYPPAASAISTLPEDSTFTDVQIPLNDRFRTTLHSADTNLIISLRVRVLETEGVMQKSTKGNHCGGRRWCYGDNHFLGSHATRTSTVGEPPLLMKIESAYRTFGKNPPVHHFNARDHTTMMLDCTTDFADLKIPEKPWRHFDIPMAAMRTREAKATGTWCRDLCFTSRICNHTMSLDIPMDAMHTREARATATCCRDLCFSGRICSHTMSLDKSMDAMHSREARATDTCCRDLCFTGRIYSHTMSLCVTQNSNLYKYHG